jgi:hypothetical protein
MEDLFAKFVATNGPAHIPEPLVGAAGTITNLFLPTWARRLVGTCRELYKLSTVGDKAFGVSTGSVGSVGGNLGPVSGMTVTTGGACATGVPGVPDALGVSGVASGSGSMCLDTGTSLMSSFAAFGIQTFVHVACTGLVSSLLGAGAGGSSSGSADECVRAALDELRTLLVGVAVEVRAVRTEMHGRFDAVDHKLECIHQDLVHAEAAIARHLACLQRVHVAGFRTLGSDLGVVSRKLAAMQEMCGDLACDVTWSALDSTLLDVQLFPDRFGPGAKPSPSQLRGWMVAIENALSSTRTRAAVRWMTKSYLVTETHTASLDDRHFRPLSSPVDAVGWLTGGGASYMPFDMYVEVLQVYHALRLWAQVVCADAPYDAAGACSRRVIAAVRDVVITPADVAAKFKTGMTLTDALVSEQRTRRLVWDTDEEAVTVEWARRQQDRWRAFAAPILHLENRICGYTNTNHEDVKWYALQLRGHLRDQYLDEVRHAASAASACPHGDQSVVVIIPPVDPPPPEHDAYTMCWTKKPFVLTGANRSTVLRTLGPFYAAERLGWGCLELILKVTQEATASVSGCSETGLVDIVPWRLAVGAFWDGAKVAEFEVASRRFDAREVSAPYLIFAGVRDGWLGRVLWDGTAATDYVQRRVFGAAASAGGGAGGDAGASVLSVTAVDAGVVDRLSARLQAHKTLVAEQKAAALAVDEARVAAVRACVRWLILLGHVRASTMDLLEAADFGGVLNDLRVASTKDVVTEWRVPYAKVALELLGG